jgi:NAD(P)-dependent dehydrogenase (short-subunit alcohol dehydrogenase family)
MDRRLRLLITGGGGALAAAVAERAAALGHAAVLVARSEGSASRLRAEGATVVVADLQDEAAVAAAVAAAEAAIGPLDAALLLAGGFATASAADTDHAALRSALAVNLLTAASVVRAVLPGMLARGGGRLIGIAAAAAQRGGARISAYAASKAALVAYLRAVDEECAAQGVGTCVITPMGTIDTAANRAAMPTADPAGWIGAPALADAILQAAAAGPRARYRTLEVHPER